MVLSLDSLPQEILHNILCYCSPCSCAALEQTARRFKCIANEPVLWRLYCRSQFKFWDARHDLARRLTGPLSAVNWKALYISRHLADRSTCQILDSILATQTGRIEKFRSILDYGCDAKDALLRNISPVVTECDYLARRSAPFPLDIVGCIMFSLVLTGPVYI